MQRYPTFSKYRQAWKNASKSTPLIPLNIDIEIASICNLKCPFCLITDKKYRQKTKKYPAFISFNSAKKIIDQSAKIGIPALKFNWIGEPTLHPDFNPILRYAYLSGFYDLIVNTNGNYRREKNEGLKYTTKVIYSIDSFNPWTYSNMRCGGNLNLIISNIKDLLKLGHKNIWLRKTITNYNQKEDFEGRTKQLFGNKVKISEHHVFNRKLTDKRNTNSIQKSAFSKRQYCEYPSQRLVIDTRGNIYPCCVDYRRTMKLGNIKKDSLLDIWHSNKLQDIRDKLKSNIMPSESCRDCRSFMAYECNYREAVMK